MKSLLKKISEKAIELGDLEFIQAQLSHKWLGTTPASKNKIRDTEERLGIELPTDYKQFLFITNGFFSPTDIDPTFESIDNVDFLKNIDSNIIEAYSIDGI